MVAFLSPRLPSSSPFVSFWSLTKAEFDAVVFVYLSFRVLCYINEHPHNSQISRSIRCCDKCSSPWEVRSRNFTHKPLVSLPVVAQAKCPKHVPRKHCFDVRGHQVHCDLTKTLFWPITRESKYWLGQFAICCFQMVGYALELPKSFDQCLDRATERHCQLFHESVKCAKSLCKKCRNCPPPPRCGYFLLFSVSYHIKVNIWAWTDETRHLQTSPETLSKWDGHFFDCFLPLYRTNIVSRWKDNGSIV